MERITLVLGLSVPFTCIIISCLCRIECTANRRFANVSVPIRVHVRF